MRVFAYIINTVSKGYKLTGCVPWVVNYRVFFGPCKRLMRPLVKRRDYILGISGSKAGQPRRILLWMHIADRMTFARAYRLGEISGTFKAARGHAIHVRPKSGIEFRRGNPECYEHIDNDAPHNEDWVEDLKNNRDVFLVGDKDSWVAEGSGPEFTKEMVKLIKPAKYWKGTVSLKNPLTRNARGKHAEVTGDAALRVVRMVGRMRPGVVPKSSRLARDCARKCGCE